MATWPTFNLDWFHQGFLYINWDEEMRDPATGDYARARNTNLNEDLGKVSAAPGTSLSRIG